MNNDSDTLIISTGSTLLIIYISVRRAISSTNHDYLRYWLTDNMKGVFNVESDHRTEWYLQKVKKKSKTNHVSLYKFLFFEIAIVVKLFHKAC